MGQLVIHDPFVHLYLMCLVALCIVHIYGFLHQAPESHDHSPTPKEAAPSAGSLIASAATKRAVPAVTGTETEAEMIVDRSNVGTLSNQEEGVR